ncbi:MAG TPA: hypothetical protein VGE29_11140 [Prosthecobacter sp.]
MKKLSFLCAAPLLLFTASEALAAPILPAPAPPRPPRPVRPAAVSFDDKHFLLSEIAALEGEHKSLIIHLKGGGRFTIKGDASDQAKRAILDYWKTL